MEKQQEQKLRHTLGAEPGRYPKKSWGFRNRYVCGAEGDADLDKLVECGFMTRSKAPVFCPDSVVYRATEQGCVAVGMSKAAIKRCFEQ